MRTTDELRNAIRSSPDPALLSGGAFTPPDYTFYLYGLLERRGWLVKDAEILKTVLVREMSELLILGAVIILRALLSLLIHFELKSSQTRTEEKP